MEKAKALSSHRHPTPLLPPPPPPPFSAASQGTSNMIIPSCNKSRIWQLKDRYRAISYKVKPPQCRPRGNMKLSPRDQIIKSSGDSISIRACSNCSTTKTPLWRSGPHGPKSLCNACGIRQRKVRRAMEAAAVCSVTKEEKPCNSSVPFKKRYKFTSSSKQKKLFVDEAVVVPVKDERDAAILLMGLSCGLIRG
ncbi:GATA transcription factor 23-like isoform X2 [Zingiber officinale]|uniref:GATA transcription factor 23-like isoform X2 n=1 Tax=Zingiber officinale TaxID=94328 RepID=UPI001C4ADB8C|nr:GATA transcription factor 23-like isoform X2 [Zingiber officinale]